MALGRDITFKGMTLSYHRISAVSVDKITLTTHVEMDSYVDQAARSADLANAISNQNFDFAAVPDTDPVAWAYDRIVGLTQADGSPGDWASAATVQSVKALPPSPAPRV